MKKSALFFALAVGLLASASTLQAQVNMSRYITLTVTNGAAIKLDFMAAAAATPVRIVSGSNTQDITVGTDWYDGNAPSNYTVTAGASTMTVYGNLTGFYCEGNGAKPHCPRPVAQYAVDQVMVWLQSAHYPRRIKQYTVGGVILLPQ